MTYVDIPFARLGLSLGLIFVAMLVSRRLSLSLEKDLVIGAARAAAQLLAVGYALDLLFGHERAIAVFGALAVMTLVAALTSARRVEHGPSARVLFPRALLAITAGGVVAVAPVLAFVVSPTPWFSGRYVIPIAGMMLANAMNVVAQVFERVFASARAATSEIEALLALGATPEQALAKQMRAAVRAAMVPTLNGLTTVGLVALPGMMTGQILSGTAPEQAVRYQLVVMYQLVAVAAVSGGLAAELARRLLFTPRAQLR